MLNITVIGDNDRDARILEQRLTRHTIQNHLQFQVMHFSSALKFIDAYKSNYDLIFMDIGMPLMSGTEMVKILRQIDRGMTLVFVINMVQYATEGYAVEALDYVPKSINDYAFGLKFKRILSHVGSQAEERIVIRTGRETVGLPVRKICYVEVDGHYLNWHTQNQIYRSLGTLKPIGEQLSESFCAISRWHVINM